MHSVSENSPVSQACCDTGHKAGIHPDVAEWHTPDLAPQCCAHPVWHPMWLSSYVAECDQIEPAFARLGATKNQDEMATVENALNKISG